MSALSSKKFIILNAAAIRRLPIRVNIRGRDHRSQRSELGENQSRKEPDESSPVSGSCRTGQPIFKRRPSRRDDRWLLVLLKSLRDQEPNVSIVPCGTDISFFHHFPVRQLPDTGLLSLSPLRDESSAHTPKPYVDAHGRLPGRRRTKSGSESLPISRNKFC